MSDTRTDPDQRVEVGREQRSTLRKQLAKKDAEIEQLKRDLKGYRQAVDVSCELRTAADARADRMKTVVNNMAWFITDYLGGSPTISGDEEED